MFRLTKIAAVVLLCGLATGAQAKGYGIGTAATQEQIAGWDIDVRPDGQGLPPGSGSVVEGEKLYEAQCASCHGGFGEGEGRWPILAGGEDTLTEERPEKTVGSYWPYLSTLWDYIHRAMPFMSPQSLEDDEVYAITAYILNLNDLVDEDFVLSKENFTSVKLPNETAFVDDPRPDVQNTRCMEKCRDEVKITMDSTSLGVTPTDESQHGADGSDIAKPADAGDAARLELGKSTYQASCGVCHDAAVAGAPKAGDKDDWGERAKQGSELLYEHAIKGYNGSKGYMPAKGGNASLDDDAVKAAVDYMLGLAK